MVASDDLDPALCSPYIMYIVVIVIVIIVVVVVVVVGSGGF